jgi:uncharacterized RmlC-like cupin family protein
MGASSIRIVRRAADSATERLGTSGMSRFEAFDDGDRWVGYTTTVPGVMSGWHHHGEHETYFYMVKGTIDLEYGPDGQERVTASAGDFVCVPAGTVHREGTPAGEPGEAVVVRVGQGPTVVNVDAPAT